MPTNLWEADSPCSVLCTEYTSRLYTVDFRVKFTAAIKLRTVLQEEQLRDDMREKPEKKRMLKNEFPG